MQAIPKARRLVALNAHVLIFGPSRPCTKFQACEEAPCYKLPGAISFTSPGHELLPWHCHGPYAAYLYAMKSTSVTLFLLQVRDATALRAEDWAVAAQAAYPPDDEGNEYRHLRLHDFSDAVAALPRCEKGLHTCFFACFGQVAAFDVALVTVMISVVIHAGVLPACIRPVLLPAMPITVISPICARCFCLPACLQSDTAAVLLADPA